MVSNSNSDIVIEFSRIDSNLLDTSASNVGGFIGFTNSAVDINNCITYGIIRGDFNVGGLVGRSTARVAIINCTANTEVGGNMHVGGFVGVCDRLNVTDSLR